MIYCRVLKDYRDSEKHKNFKIGDEDRFEDKRAKHLIEKGFIEKINNQFLDETADTDSIRRGRPKNQD